MRMMEFGDRDMTPEKEEEEELGGGVKSTGSSKGVEAERGK